MDTVKVAAGHNGEHYPKGSNRKAYSYIRFSTPGQEAGDSLRRQIEQSEKYCQEHGLTLDDTLRLTDRGLSAFHGVNRTRGALGEFHRLVEQGEVEPGSVLLVESLDRLSREQVLDALTQFTSLIRAGIKVVTLADRMEYDRESINSSFGQLLMSLVIMSRAHEESAIKSHRGKEAWKNKRKLAKYNGHKLTAQSPAWLAYDKGRKSFAVIPEAVAAVNRIYQLRLEGRGSRQIAKTLNMENAWTPPPKGKGKKAGGWRKSYTDKILTSRAVIGEYQPHTKVNGKRTPTGDPIPGYFPAIVGDRLFYQVQEAIRQNRETNGNGGGRTGQVNNLFAYIGRCAYCGGPMAYVNKGKPPKGGQYLVCDTARKGLGCKKTYVRYGPFERLLLIFGKGLNPADILPEGGRSEIAVLRSELQGVEGELAQVERKIQNLMGSLEDADTPEFVKLVKEKIQTHQARQAELTRQAGDLQEKIVQATSTEANVHSQLQSVKELVDRMTSLEGQERVNLRLSLRNQLRRLIDRINILPDINQVGILFKTGERRLLIVRGNMVALLDKSAGVENLPPQLGSEPIQNRCVKLNTTLGHCAPLPGLTVRPASPAPGPAPP